jgi:hypothetical protein
MDKNGQEWIFLVDNPGQLGTIRDNWGQSPSLRRNGHQRPTERRCIRRKRSIPGDDVTRAIYAGLEWGRAAQPTRR